MMPDPILVSAFNKAKSFTTARNFVTLGQVISMSRKEDIVILRSAVVYILRKNGLVYTDIGKLMGGRHHATMIHACKRFHVMCSWQNSIGEWFRDIRDTFAEINANAQEKTTHELPNLEGNPNRCVYHNVSFLKWKRELRKQQLYYPALKFQKLDKEMLKHYYNEGFEPIDACNDMLTVT